MKWRTWLLLFPSLFSFLGGMAFGADLSTDRAIDDDAGSFGKFLAPESSQFPFTIKAIDAPFDQGGRIDLSFDLTGKNGLVEVMTLQRRTELDLQFVDITALSPNTRHYTDNNEVKNNVVYIYRLKISFKDGRTAEVLGEPTAASVQWFALSKLNVLFFALLLSLALIVYISSAKKGRQFFIRKIAGLDAIDEAIGRATEMGRSILFVPGIQDMDNVQTIAGLILLSRIARSVAEYDTKLDVPVSKSLVMTTAREMVREAFISAGRPDVYKDDIVRYLTDEQFAYVAGVNGIIVREKPATCFYMGAFFAESLILAETGNSIGSIQIAGTAMPSQIPFFIAACDYTLIGEEFFAASAYLSNDPQLLGSLKGQDLGKVVAMAAIIVGSLALTLNSLADYAFIDTIVSLIKAFFSEQLPASWFV